MGLLTKLTSIGYCLLVAVVAVAIWDLSNANRPHELKGMNLLMVLLAIGSAIGVKVALELWRFWRIRKSVQWRVSRLLLVGSAVIYLPLVAFLTTVVFAENFMGLL